MVQVPALDYLLIVLPIGVLGPFARREWFYRCAGIWCVNIELGLELLGKGKNLG